MTTLDGKAPIPKREAAILVSARGCAADIQGMSQPAAERVISEYIANMVARARLGEFD